MLKAAANTEQEKTTINSAVVRELHSHTKNKKKQHVRKLRSTSQSGELSSKR